MKHIFLHSSENIELAHQEIMALSKLSDISNCKLIKNVSICDTLFSFERLAMTRKVYEYLFECNKDEIIDKMNSFDWTSLYKTDFSFRIIDLSKKSSNTKSNTNIEAEESKYAKYIWRNIKNPKVKLKNSKTPIEMIIIDDTVLFGKLVYQQKKEFEKRHPKHRPGKHPTTILPKLARACVNLTGVPNEGEIIDPFCGTGGFLVEAGLMKIKTTGYDISSRMLEHCKENLYHYDIQNFTLEKKDATKIEKEIKYLVTDLPYGKGSYLSDEKEQLYKNFLSVLSKRLSERAVIIFPNHVDHKKIIESTKLTISHEFSVYVHKSLTRKIVILESS